MDHHLIEEKVTEKNVFSGVLLDVYCDEIRLPDGTFAKREYIRHPGAVCIVPITDAGEVITVRQYRYPIGRVTVEIPAGKLDRGEAPIDAARRELWEETGVKSAKLTYLGGLYPSVAYTDEMIHIYLAENLEYGVAHPDADEFLDVIKIPLDEFVEKIMNAEILDAKTQIAVLKAAKVVGFSEGKGDFH